MQNGQSYTYSNAKKEIFNRMLFKKEGDVSLGKIFSNEIRNELETTKRQREGKATQAIKEAHNSIADLEQQEQADKDAQAYLDQMDADFETRQEYYKKYLEELNEIRDALKEQRKTMKSGSDEIFESFQKEREIAFKAREVDRMIYKEPEPEKVKTGRTINPNPEKTAKNRKTYITVLTAMSGENEAQVTQRIENYKSQGLSEDEAANKVFAETKLPTDQKIVSIDFETASGGSTVDPIEVGYVVRYPDGRVKHVDYLAGADKRTLNREGTTWEDTHGISPEEIEHLPRLAESEDKQKEIVSDLDGAVIVAHNARFEVDVLERSVRGFNKDNVRILDTMNVSKYFLKTENNKNESFVESQGFKYENGHVAHKDAQMTLNALLKLKGEDLIPDKKTRKNKNNH